MTTESKESMKEGTNLTPVVDYVSVSSLVSPAVAGRNH